MKEAFLNAFTVEQLKSLGIWYLVILIASLILSRLGKYLETRERRKRR